MMPIVTRRRVGSAGEPAQELVEFAILLPVLLLIAFGVLDLGRTLHTSIAITNAAREGARYGMIYPSDVPGIIAASQREAQASGIDLTTSLIDVSCPEGCGSGLPVRVTVTYDFTLIMALVFADPNLQLFGTAEMMVP